MAEKTQDQIVRRLLEAIEGNAALSQRNLSAEIGIAVGSVNWYLRRCVTKGFIKLQQVPVKRYLYFLTPRGLEEKARLTGFFLHSSFALYRRGRKECGEFFRFCKERNKKVLFLVGDGEFAEIALLSSLVAGPRPAAIIDKNSARKAYAGVVLTKSLDGAINAANGCLPDAILITDLLDPRGVFLEISAEIDQRGLSQDLIHIPPLLNFSPEHWSDVWVSGVGRC